MKIYKFNWRGINRAGKTITGKCFATDAIMAKKELRLQGILVKKIHSSFFSRFTFKPVRNSDITFFTRQLAILTLANVPLLQAFSIIIATQKTGLFQYLLLCLKRAVAAGHSLSSVLAQHTNYFNHFYCSLVAIGELSGSLDLMLEKIANYREKMLHLKQQIHKALFYPAIIMLIAIIITSALLLFIVPQFENLFKNFGARLPAATQIIIDIAHFIQRYGWLFCLTISSLLCIVIFLCKTSSFFLQKMTAITLHLPLAGVLIKKAFIARMASTLHILLAAGIPLGKALQVTAGMAQYPLYVNALQQVHSAINKGQSLQSALRQTQQFPVLVEQLIGIGEESGHLESMLIKIADIYAKEVDNIIIILNTLLEPLIMITLGLLIGGLVVAMYLPIFKLGSII